VTDVPREALERRLLILAPVGKDAALIESMLQSEDVECATCADLTDLLKELERGAAAMLVAEEALTDGDARLPSFLARQPAWSDIPILLMTRPGADSAYVERASNFLGNVTLLERPIRVVALFSAIRSALRARARQYQTRAYLLEREQADNRKDEFLATLAHELRNPLAPIRNWVNVLRLTRSDERGSHIWDMMDRQVSHMVRLVDDLMELSRITRGKIDLRIEAVELAPVIAAAVEASRPLIEGAHHTLTVEIPDEPIVVSADAVRLAQIVSNLLNNAAKYTDDGGSILLSVRRDGSQAVITVKDTGSGISPEALPRVFDMFVQEELRDHRPKGGLGIGLTLVRSLVEMHGGRVEAHSDGPGKGSEFVVRLPLSASVPVRADQGVLPIRKPRRMTRVLVVDDNEDAAESLGALLRMMGADVRVAQDGWTALEIFDSFKPAAVFLDLGMPDMDGFEVAHQIRSRPNTKDTVLIALTGWSQERDKRRTAEAGFDRHLAKPADLETLQSVLTSLAS
jgi:signal transduction histidine kinase/CheY-like chemotaxis protein